MCTAVSISAENHYFGRNLDFEHDFDEKIVITPRSYNFEFSNGISPKTHYAIIGMAIEEKNYPLYFDAANEKGLAMAGLYFRGNAFYEKHSQAKNMIASYEFIPYILSQCESVKEAKELLSDLKISDKAFSTGYPPSPLHWLIADKSETITVEQTKKGLFVHQNPVGVLTNNPTFDVQLLNLSNYLHLKSEEPNPVFLGKTELFTHSKGMGAIGLPGDMSSMSRFVRACFVKLNSHPETLESKMVSQFFRVLYSVYQPKGAVVTKDGFEMTHYTSCINTSKGIYYYTSYYNPCINSVDMHREKLDSRNLVSYDLIKGECVFAQN